MMTALRLHPRTVVDLNGVGLAVAGEPFRAFRDHDLGAEFLRLCVGAPRELLTGNAGRKAQIVLDFRARSGLSARRIRLQHEDIQSLRRTVHRSCEARRSGADDDDVAHMRLVDCVVEAEAVGDL